MSPTTPEMQRRVAHLVETFQIEHGIPLTRIRRGLSGRILASLIRMQPPNGDGKPVDSFLVPCNVKDRSIRGSTSSCINHAVRICQRQHPDWDFTTRTVEGGVRCWRIK